MFEKDMKNLAWNTFKQTGNIDTFMEFIQMKNLEESKMQNNIGNVVKNDNIKID